MLVCPKCHHSLSQQEEKILCQACHSIYRIKDNIPIFAAENNYWCNVDRETMHQLISDAETSRDWEKAAKRHIPRCTRHSVPLHRGDAQFLFPINSASRVLDAGSMWGGITVPLARYCKEVYAVDKTWETLRFLQVKASQLHLDNVIPVVSSIHSLPFPDGFFDFVVLNGVLEWLGTEQDIVLEKNWNGRRNDTYYYESDPKEMQLAGLKELFRVTRPGGAIYVAVENRIGLPYFLGHPDDHANVRFVSFLPRRLADFITKKVHNSAYRTYLYSPKKLVRLIEETGFSNTKLFSAYPHYNTVARMTPFAIFDKLGKIPLEGGAPFRTSLRIKVFMFSKVWKLIPKRARKYLSPSLSLIALKGTSTNGIARLLTMLTQVGVLGTDEVAHHEAILVNNRFDDGNPVNYLIYDTAKAVLRFFCKIDRRGCSKALKQESELIAYAAERLKGTALDGTVPKLYYSGIIDQVPIQVTSYIAGRRIGNHTLDALRRLDQFVTPKGRRSAWAIDQVKRATRIAWLPSVRRTLIQAVDWLVSFQELTRVRSLDVGTMSTAWMEKNISRMIRNGIDVSTIEKPLQTVVDALKSFGGIQVPICMQHGDFDICNLLTTSKGIAIIDFEHAEKEGLPFFDLGNLIFSPLLLEWRNDFWKRTLSEYACATGWKNVLKACVHCYAEKTGLPAELLRLLPALSAIEQNAKLYPEHRDPYTYPMFGQEPLENMVGWTLQI